MFKERKLKTGKRNQRARWIYGKERSRKTPVTEPQGKLKGRSRKTPVTEPQEKLKRC